MHPYATDTEERRTIPFMLAVMGILLALGLSKLLTALSWEIPWWFDTPAAFGFYGLLYAAYDRWIWKTPMLHQLPIITVTPDLSGEWHGEIKSSYDNHETTHKATITIEQNWTTISIVLKTAESKSESTIASIGQGSAKGATLTYQYANEPKSGAKKAMHMHRGTATLSLSKEGKTETLEGDYYTGRGRKNHGEMHLTKKKG